MSHIEGGAPSVPVDIPAVSTVSTSLDVSSGSAEPVGPTANQRPGGELSATQPSRFAPSITLEQTSGVTASPVAETPEEPTDLHESVRTEHRIVPSAEKVQEIYRNAGVDSDGTLDLGDGNVRMVHFKTSSDDGPHEVEQTNEGDKGYKVEGIAGEEEQQAERDMQRRRDTSVSSEVVAKPVEARKPGAEDSDTKLHLDTASGDVVPARKQIEDPLGTLDDDIAQTETPADQEPVKALEIPDVQETPTLEGEEVVTEQTDTPRDDIVAENEQAEVPADTNVEAEAGVTESPARGEEVVNIELAQPTDTDVVIQAQAPEDDQIEVLKDPSTLEEEIVDNEVVETEDPTETLAESGTPDEPEVIGATENPSTAIELAQPTDTDVVIQAPEDDQIEVLEDASDLEEGPEQTPNTVVVFFDGPNGLKKNGDFPTVSDVIAKEEVVEIPPVTASVNEIDKISGNFPQEKAAAVGGILALHPGIIDNYLAMVDQHPVLSALFTTAIIGAVNTFPGLITSTVDGYRDEHNKPPRFQRETLALNDADELVTKERHYGVGGIYFTIKGDKAPLPQYNPKAAAAGIPGPDSLRLREIPDYLKENVHIPSVPALPVLPAFRKPLEENPRRFPLDEHGRDEIIARFREVDSKKRGRERNGATPEALAKEAAISLGIGATNALLLKQGMPEIPAGATGTVSTIYGIKKGWTAFKENQEGKRSDFGAGKYNHHVFKDNEIVGVQRTAEGVALIAADATTGVFDGAQTVYYLSEAAFLASKAAMLSRDNFRHGGLRKGISKDDARRAQVHARATTLETKRHRLDPQSETGKAIVRGGSTRHSGLTKKQREAIKAARGNEAAIEGILEAARASLSDRLRTLEEQAGYVPGQDPPKDFFGKEKGKWFIAE